MRRFCFGATCVMLFALSTWAFIHFALGSPPTEDPYDHYSLWLVFGLPGLLMCLGLVALCITASDNIYWVKSGIVISHRFTAAHEERTFRMYGKVVMPATEYVPADWALCVRDSRGREGWLHFSSNVFSRYPIGSHYPEAG